MSCNASKWLLLAALLLTHCSPFDKYKASVTRWEEDIRKFEQLDLTESYPEGSILFVGSSSIRRWETIAEDMQPYPVIQRGFGGCKLPDVCWYAGRIIYPHNPRALVLFVGNDISGTEADKTPEEVARLFEHLLKIVRKKFSTMPIFYIEITPTEKRWAVWPQIQQANRALREVCLRSKGVYFIDTSAKFLGPEGKPASGLFVNDRLHLNRAGYRIWSHLIRTELDKIL